MSELQYFAALLHDEDIGALRLVDPERDLTPAWRAVYAWIVNFARDRNALPKPLTVGGTFSIPLDRPPEKAAYYATIITKNVKRSRLEEELTTKVVPHLEGHDPDQAIAAAAEAIGQVRAEFPEPDDSRCFLPTLQANVEERWADYQYRVAHQGQLGIPLPWPSITRLTLGMQPGEAWSIVSRPNIGKTWSAIVIAIYLWQMGYRVLFASMETPPRNAVARSPRARARLGEWADVPRQRLTLRFDAIGARVSAWRLLNGKLNPQEMFQYQNYLAMCRNEIGAGWGTIRMVSSPRVRTVSQLEQEIAEFEPDLVIWDSAYVAIGRGTKTKNGRTDAAGYFLEDCKSVFERRGVPGLLTWHFNREVDEDATEASTNFIALTDDMPRLFDVILFLFRTPEMINAGEALWRSGKIRDGINLPELRTRFEIKRHIAFEEIMFGAPVAAGAPAPTGGAQT